MDESTKFSLSDQKAHILRAICGEVELPTVSQMYVIGLFFTACTALLLPLLYFSVIALAAIGPFAFIKNGDSIMVGWQPGAKVTAISIVGCISAAFVVGLFKPFFARLSAVKRPLTLRRDVEPFLYEYVNKLCETLGTLRPTDIHINCDLNAAAEFRKGCLSIFSRRGISLHLGMPLVAGLTLRQFTGVLAHELGHFSQRTAMWLENLVRRINNWFFRAAYERDAIDEWLASECARGGPLVILCYGVRIVVWVTRRVLFALAIAGTTIGCLMMREMEFNADRCQVRTVGPRTLASTMWRLRQLSVAHQVSFRDVAAFYDEGRLPDDIVSLVVANTSFITPKVKKKLRRMMVDEKTGLFDSHPSDRDRIHAAQRDGSPGFFQDSLLPRDVPASILFSRFEEISKVVTTQFYTEALKQKIKPRLLHPVEKLLERQRAEIDAAKALKRYFQTEIPPLRPLPITAESLLRPENPRETLAELKSCREQMIAELPEYKRLSLRYQTAEETLFETIAAQAIMQAAIRFKPSEFHLKEAHGDAIADKQSRARIGLNHLAGRLLTFEAEAGNRLSFALQLLQVPAVTRKIDSGDELLHEINGLLPEAQFISHLMAELPPLRIIFCRLMTLWERQNGKRGNRPAIEIMVKQMESLRNRLVSIHNEMGNHLYPFDHARANTTLQEYALPEIPGEYALGDLVEATANMQSRLTSIQTRLFARLAQAAEKVEAAIGMPPLPDPDVDTEDLGFN